MSGEANPLALERNLALFAGAGSGKTHGLITLCLHLLAGARAQGPVPPSRLWLVTFTDKAAGEMRERLRLRVESLVREGDAREPELRASFERLGRPPPPMAFWRGVLDALGGATVTTFHAACGQLLRRAPAGTGLSPDFELLDEREAQLLIQECAERVVLEALEAELPGAVALCRDLEFGGGSGRGLTGALVGVFGKLREEGLSPAGLRTGDAQEARADFEQALGALKTSVLEAMRLDAEAKGRFSAFLSRCAQVLERLRFEGFWTPEGYPALFAAAKANKVSGSADLKAAIAEVKQRILGKDDQVGLASFHAAILAADHERAFLTLVERLAERHREQLSRRNAQDFAGLLITTRDLLASNPGYRREVQARIGALLVDEFQDTNRIQLELVTLLAERRDGEVQVVSPEAALALPLEPALLCAVGDRKQSIYEFRGADVSVFEALAAKIVAEGGVRTALQRSWRSVPGLVDGVNALFASVMLPAADPREYEVGWDPTLDALTAERTAAVSAPPIEVLAQEPSETSEASRVDEAERLALRLAELLRSDTPWVGERDGSMRRLRGGDVAILLRGFPSLEIYRQALMRHGLPHRVIRGRGFYGAQEVLDVASLLSVTADPEDGLALAAVLRSPWVGLSDAAWVALGTGRGGLTVAALQASPDRAQLAEDERARLDRFLHVFGRLRTGVARPPVATLLRLAFAELPYREAVAAAPFGEQSLANLDKLLALAEAWDRRSPGDLDGFALELVGLASAEPREAQADPFDLDDPRAIQILTVHQSKGLEWPLVVVPNLAAKSPGWTEPWFFDRTQGFALKVRQPDGGLAHTPRSKRISKELGRRAAAESRRVLYVALTRARDRLVLSGRAEQEANTWRAMLQGWIPEAAGAGQLAVVEPGPAVASPRAAANGSAQDVAAAIARVRAPLPAPCGEWVLPVTRLELFEACPRRYWLNVELGLSEPAGRTRGSARGSPTKPQALTRGGFDRLGLDGETAEGGREQAQERGTLAHRLLEQVDLSLPAAERKAQLSRLIVQEARSPDGPELAEVQAWVEAFLEGEWGTRLAQAGSRVHREQPFVLRIPAGEVALCLKGKIDLLVEEADGVTVLDYKTARTASDEAAYAFQLGCYALAARAWCPPGGQVRTGVVQLRQGGAVTLVPRLDLDALELQLGALGRALVQAVEAGAWEGRPKDRCQAMGCGFVERCHKGGAAL